MADLVEEVAAFLRRTKLPLEQALKEVPRRWPEIRGGQFERAARLAIQQLQDDARTQRAMARLWEGSAAARGRRASRHRGRG